MPVLNPNPKSLLESRYRLQRYRHSSLSEGLARVKASIMVEPEGVFKNATRFIGFPEVPGARKLAGAA